MRFRRRRRDDEADDGVNIVSLLDVILNLLFFFMVGATFEKSVGSLRVNAPTVGEQTAQKAPPPEGLARIVVAKDGTFELDGSPGTAEQIVAGLKKAMESGTVKRVLIEADAAATVQDAATAIDLCRKAGVEEVMQVVKRAKGQ